MSKLSTLDRDQEAPVFVRGMSRSGGTLMVTLLDAHPSFAMSYELYPTLLEKEGGVPYTLLELCSASEFGGGIGMFGKLFGRVSGTNSSNLGLFARRVARSGVDPKCLSHRFKRYQSLLEEGPLCIESRIFLIGEVARVKRDVSGAKRWGMKCGNAFESYVTAFPKAKILNITRDGRDVAASQKKMGTFKNPIQEVARCWVYTHRAFNAFTEKFPESGLQVIYEDLVNSPGEVLRTIIEFLGEEWSEAMMSHESQNLTIFKVRHASGERLKQGIDASMVGRWRTDLTKEDVKEFEAGAGELLKELGYIK